MKRTEVMKARMSAFKTLEDFAPLLGVSVPTLSKWENDPNRYFTPDRLKTYYNNVQLDGKHYLQNYVANFFKNECTFKTSKEQNNDDTTLHAS